MNLVVGRIEGHAKGYAFLLPDNPDIEDIYINHSDLNGAMHGDQVMVRPKTAKGRQEGKIEGEVLRILKGLILGLLGPFIGIVLFFVIPDDKRFYHDIFLSQKEKMMAMH